MDNLIITNIITLSGIALLAAIILYFVSQKFKVEQNPLVEEIDAELPQVNCGACGKAGCFAFASACVSASEQEFKSLYCTVGGAEVMKRIADKLGYIAEEKEDTVAVLRCQGTCQNAPDKVEYTGVSFCRIANSISSGRSGCPNGCLRLGDCVRACPFHAIHIDESTGIPVYQHEKLSGGGQGYCDHARW